MSDNCCSSSTARLTAHIGGLILEKGSFSSEEESNSHNHHHHGCVVALDIRQEGALKDLEELASWHSNSNRDLMVNDVSDEEEDDHEGENVHNIIDHSRGQQQQQHPQQPQQQQQQQRPIRPRMPPKAFNASVAMPRDNDLWKPRQSTRKTNKKRQQQQKQSSSKNLSPPRSMLQKAGSLLFGNSKRNSQDDIANVPSGSITKDAETVRKEWQRQNLLMAAGQFESSTTMMSMSTSSWGSSNRRSAAGRQ